METDPMNVTQNQTQTRRHYPKDVQGLKSEWYGIEHHLQEIGLDIQRNEREILNLRKKELLTELDRKMLEQLQIKQKELEQKYEDAQEMKRRQLKFQEEQRKFLEDRAILQKGISSIYDKQKQDSLIREMDMRQQKLEWEQQALEENRRRMEQDFLQRRLQKEQWAKEQDADLKLSQLRHMEERERYRSDQIEIQELNRRNAEKELIKEENYKNFYRLCSQNQAQLQKMHIDNVLQPLLERQAQLESLIAKNMDAYQRKLLQDELDRVLKRQEECRSTLNVNKKILDEREQGKYQEKSVKQELNKQRLEDLQNYNQFLVQKKVDQVEQQRQYKEYLDQQRIEKEEQRLKQLRMGRQEKSMNMLDLQAYKNQDAQLNAKIIGWSPQVGQLPPKQDYLLKQQSLTQLKQDEMNTINQNLSNVSQVSRGQALRGAGQNAIHQNHNPVTNPIPFNNQNPYIQKQYEQMIRPRPY
ncbi:unnamed protein product (macronuclear) [Paramecium tetraurelia]|uniref:Trichohyalin-plectin-homology domain-containing protein n=1 Tax=Paramecium tetraurelia TaxID=5888 RepID=A0DN08_PARTE|nr:uncharacterized protein GSPATT00018630001 [Paramecium tetraurelia]CAK84425.1 unnamed protein product [Paramecium tetraurelia]|eukprot:XP_001451822.1 hypothetical protein (macronuclear) [Paramecium tetraurelia strain d4-2]